MPMLHPPSPPQPLNPSHRPRERGFTLTELMAVVVIMGILATLAMVGYRKYLNSARSSEAAWMVNGIRAAQEAYRAETLSYLNVSAGSLANYYPTTDPMDRKVQWGGDGNNVGNWRILNVTTDGAVYYGYSCVAGPPGVDIELTGAAFTVTAPAAAQVVEPWYAVQAKGNVDGDADYSYYFASSFSNEVYWLNEGE